MSYAITLQDLDRMSDYELRSMRFSALWSELRRRYGFLDADTRDRIGALALARAREQYRDLADADLAVHASWRYFIPHVMCEECYGLDFTLDHLEAIERASGIDSLELVRLDCTRQQAYARPWFQPVSDDDADRLS